MRDCDLTTRLRPCPVIFERTPHCLHTGLPRSRLVAQDVTLEVAFDTAATFASGCCDPDATYHVFEGRLEVAVFPVQLAETARRAQRLSPRWMPSGEAGMARLSPEDTSIA